MNTVTAMKISDALTAKATDEQTCSEVMALLNLTLVNLKNKFNLEDERILLGMRMALKLADITHCDTKESDSILEIIKEL